MGEGVNYQEKVVTFPCSCKTTFFRYNPFSRWIARSDYIFCIKHQEELANAIKGIHREDHQYSGTTFKQAR